MHNGRCGLILKRWIQRRPCAEFGRLSLPGNDNLRFETTSTQASVIQEREEMVLRIFFVLVVIFMSPFSAVAEEDRGAAQLTLDGGSRGVVPFPHHRHQNTLGDCNACHNLFPKELGGIQRLKKEGKLVKKQVMNKHCIKCHKAQKKLGNPSGPKTCSKCHLKQG